MSANSINPGQPMQSVQADQIQIFIVNQFSACLKKTVYLDLDGSYKKKQEGQDGPGSLI